MGTALFARLPAGARAEALGGGVSAADDEPTAAFANPAGLALGEAPLSLAGGTAGLGLGRTASFVAAAGWVSPEIAVAVAAVGIGLGDDLEVRRANTAAPEDVWTATAAVYTFAFALRLFPALDAGLSMRVMHQEVGVVDADGFSGDAGLLYRPWTRVRLGLLARDVPGTTFDWSTGGSDRLARTLSLGAGVDLNPVLLVGQLEDVGSEYPRRSVGVEWDVHPLAAARAGLNGAAPAFGFGIRVPRLWRRLDLRADYAFAADRFGAGAAHHRLAFAAAYAVPAWPTRKLLFPSEDEVPGMPVPPRRPPPLFPPLL